VGTVLGIIPLHRPKKCVRPPCLGRREAKFYLSFGDETKAPLNFSVLTVRSADYHSAGQGVRSLEVRWGRGKPIPEEGRRGGKKHTIRPYVHMEDKANCPDLINVGMDAPSPMGSKGGWV